MKLRIGTMILDFNYHFEDYFQQGLTSYQVEDSTPANAILRTHLVDCISPPLVSPFLVHHGKNLYIEGNLQTLVIHNKQNIPFQMIQSDFERIEINIFLHRHLVPRLAEQEYVLASIQFLSMAAYFGYLGIHASSLLYHGLAFLFAAPSQTGKSTLARRFIQAYKEATMINDDKPLLFMKDNHLYVQGSPFAGGSVLHENVSAPLGVLIFLKQGPTNHLVPLQKEDALPWVMRNIARPNEESLWDKVLPLVQHLINSVPLFIYEATNDDSAISYLTQALKKENIL